MILIPTYNGKEVIDRCLESWKYTKEPVLVVDTHSTDLNHIQYTQSLCKKYKFMWDQTPYKNYALGAITHMISKYKDSWYFITQDSLFLKHPISVPSIKSLSTPICSWLDFDSDLYACPEQRIFIEKTFGCTHFNRGIVGPIFGIKDDFLRFLYKKYNISNITIKDKHEAAAMERGWAVLCNLEKIHINNLEFCFNRQIIDADEFKFFTKVIKFRD